MPRPLALACRLTLRLRRWTGAACLAGLICAVLLGVPLQSTSAASWFDWPLFRSQSPDEEPQQETRNVRPGTTLNTPYVGEYITAFGGTGVVPIEGVGLVVGLDNTGEDPPPSHYRTILVDEMRKRGIDNPNTILARPDTAMVLIRALIPVNSRVGDKFDAHVVLPPNGAATSLAGGYLMEARLAENRRTQGGRLLTGDVLATVSGPILVSMSDSTRGGNPKTGKILGGVRSKMDRHLTITLRSEFRSGRNTVRIAEVIGKRFHGHDKNGLKVPMAEPKDDQLIELMIPDQYRENYPRYLAVIRNLAFRESEIALRVRMQKLEQEINIPAESELAALRLEGIGDPAAPILKRALQNKDLEARFNAAMALTYMGYTDGLETLAVAAREEPAFRVYALAALACCKEAEAAVALHELLGEKIAETRYGAFRALTVLNSRDPIVAGVPMTGGEKEPTYMLHVLNVDGPPLVHLTHHTKAEVVLFDARQRLQLPAALRCGPHIQVVASPGSREVVVVRYRGKHAGRKVVSPNLAEIITACDELGATYPDIVAMLVQADKQFNLPGELEIDALPQAGRLYAPKDSTGGKRTIGNKYTAPNMLAPPASEAAEEREQDLDSVPARQPSLTDTQRDSSIQPTSATDETTTGGEGGIVTADHQTPAADAAPSQNIAMFDEAADAGDAEMPNNSSGSNGPKWYDPRRLFQRPDWLGSDGPPVQSEPGVP